LIQQWIDLSYDLVVASLPKKEREALKDLWQKASPSYKAYNRQLAVLPARVILKRVAW
jgi:hypothetical protein